MTAEPSPAGQALPPRIDTSIPHVARMWNYWLGGKDHYADHREAGDQFSRPFPGRRTVRRRPQAVRPTGSR
ncbi:SAM-dependent methyltransferase [Nonomuraea basaltis]|uniref:SAM-dependent methyltransferase n=1 Tax=Nonomuraea basaltis TaxID=2495887 RepID=UPI00110C58B5|nr:SAM-dependent methyltransferase [Nonomuraea basaltis]TMR98750.1 hypothetical protein EJK15_11485 [Nonomuraea basaltis]